MILHIKGISSVQNVSVSHVKTLNHIQSLPFIQLIINVDLYQNQYCVRCLSDCLIGNISRIQQLNQKNLGLTSNQKA